MPDTAPTNTPARPYNPKHAKIVAWVLVLIGAPMLLWGGWFLNHAMASSSWPSVEGTVLRTPVRTEFSGSGSTRTRTYKFEVHYAYTVNGTRHQSDSYAMGHGSTAGGSGTHAGASEKARTAYPKGKRVPVHYNPDDPAEAVLVKGASGANWGIYVPMILGLFFAAFGVWILRKLPSMAAASAASAASTG